MSTHCLSVDVCVRIIYSLSHKLSLSVSSLSQSCYDSSIVIEMFDISSQLCGVVCGVWDTRGRELRLVLAPLRVLFVFVLLHKHVALSSSASPFPRFLNRFQGCPQRDNNVTSSLFFFFLLRLFTKIWTFYTTSVFLLLSFVITCFI